MQLRDVFKAIKLEIDDKNDSGARREKINMVFDKEAINEANSCVH